MCKCFCIDFIYLFIGMIKIEIFVRKWGLKWYIWIVDLVVVLFVSNYFYNSMGRGRSENWVL